MKTAKPWTIGDRILAVAVLAVAALTVTAGARSWRSKAPAATGYATTNDGYIACASEELLADFGRAARTRDTSAVRAVMKRGCVAVGPGLSIKLLSSSATTAHFQLGDGPAATELWAPLEIVHFSGS